MILHRHASTLHSLCRMHNCICLLYEYIVVNSALYVEIHTLLHCRRFSLVSSEQSSRPVYMQLLPLSGFWERWWSLGQSRSPPRQSVVGLLNQFHSKSGSFGQMQNQCRQGLILISTEWILQFLRVSHEYLLPAWPRERSLPRGSSWFWPRSTTEAVLFVCAYYCHAGWV